MQATSWMVWYHVEQTEEFAHTHLTSQTESWHFTVCFKTTGGQKEANLAPQITHKHTSTLSTHTPSPHLFTHEKENERDTSPLMFYSPVFSSPDS